MREPRIQRHCLRMRLGSHYIWSCILLFWGCLLLPLPANAPHGVEVRASGEGDEVSVRGDGRSGTVVIRSQRGIGSCTLKRVGTAWPKRVTLRLHLKGLESLKIASGDVLWGLSLASTGDPMSRVSLIQHGKEKRLKKGDAYWATARIVAKEKRIPLRDGYVEVVIPDKLLSKRSESLEVRWIDFYRG